MKSLGLAATTALVALSAGPAFAAVGDNRAASALTGDPLALNPIALVEQTANGAGRGVNVKMGGGYGGGMKMGGFRGHGMKMGGGWGNRWGGKIGGRWNGGVKAPGGYKAYRRPNRGFRLPSYWMQSSFLIPNYSTYGFYAPSSGYGWSRYYDDAVLTDRYGTVYDTRNNIDWDRYDAGYRDGYADGRATYDHSVILNDSHVTAEPVAPVSESGAYQGHWDGAYLSDGSYQGEWKGTYEGADGRVYEGQYSGTFQGSGGMAPAGSYVPHTAGETVHYGTDYDRKPGHHYDYGQRYEYGREYEHGAERGYADERAEELAYLERCKESSGLTGALIGGAVGAVAGNRIAGRGDRLAGSLIGGGVGALAGAAIDKGTDRCRRLLKKYGGRPAPAHEGYGANYGRSYSHGYGHGYAYPYSGYGWQGGYYYYPQPAVTTVVISGGGATTTTTTTEVIEEEYYVEPKGKKLYKPAARRTWKPAPAPMQKGCHTVDCEY